MAFSSLDGLPRFAPGVRILHWLVALLVLVVLPIGFIVDSIKDEDQPIFYFLHESLGFLLLWVMLARLAVRLLAPPEPPAPWLTPFERIVSHAVQGLLYVALIAQPIVGFLMGNAQGFPLTWFDLLPIPSPIGADPVLADYLATAHLVLGWSILVLFLLHMAGVLQHHLIKRDPTLYRIL